MLSWSVIEVFTQILMAWSIRRMATIINVASLPLVKNFLKALT